MKMKMLTAALGHTIAQTMVAAEMGRGGASVDQCLMSPAENLGRGVASNANSATKILCALEIGVGHGVTKGYMDRPLRFGKGEGAGTSLNLDKRGFTKLNDDGHISGDLPGAPGNVDADLPGLPGHIAIATGRATFAQHV